MISEKLKENTIRNDILQNRRGYFIDKVKAPLVKALIILANRYPEPTKKNTQKHNTHVMLDIWDEFFKYNEVKNDMFHAIKKVVADEYEHDDVYETRMTWFLEKLVEKYLSGEWWPSKPFNPSHGWTEPAAIEAQKKVVRELLKDQKLHGTGFLTVS